MTEQLSSPFLHHQVEWMVVMDLVNRTNSYSIGKVPSLNYFVIIASTLVAYISISSHKIVVLVIFQERVSIVKKFIIHNNLKAVHEHLKLTS